MSSCRTARVGQMVWPKEGAPAHTYMKEPLESFAPVKSVEGGPVLMGCFEDKDGNAAIMLVNMTDPGPAGNGQGHRDV